MLRTAGFARPPPALRVTRASTDVSVCARGPQGFHVEVRRRAPTRQSQHVAADCLRPVRTCSPCCAGVGRHEFFLTFDMPEYALMGQPVPDWRCHRMAVSGCHGMPSHGCLARAQSTAKLVLTLSLGVHR